MHIRYRGPTVTAICLKGQTLGAISKLTWFLSKRENPAARRDETWSQSCAKVSISNQPWFTIWPVTDDMALFSRNILIAEGEQHRDMDRIDTCRVDREVDRVKYLDHDETMDGLIPDRIGAPTGESDERLFEHKSAQF